MISPYQAAKLRRAISKLVVCEREWEMAGAGHPEDVPLLEEELKEARTELKRYIELITDTAMPAEVR